MALTCFRTNWAWTHFMYKNVYVTNQQIDPTSPQTNMTIKH